MLKFTTLFYSLTTQDGSEETLLFTQFTSVLYRIYRIINNMYNG